MSRNHRRTSLSFFAFVQRLHQHASMKEIAEKLQAGFVQAQELKDYTAAICCESYYDLPLFQRERAMLEKNYPTYAETKECTGNPVWGAFKLGRLPAFIYEDAKKYAPGARITRFLGDGPCE